MSVSAVAEGGPEGAGAVILLRRVSGRPGAEGAPLEGRGRLMGISWRVEVFEVDVGWFAGGAMRRDCLCQRWHPFEYTITVVMAVMAAVMIMMMMMMMRCWVHTILAFK